MEREPHCRFCKKSLISGKRINTVPVFGVSRNKTLLVDSGQDSVVLAQAFESLRYRFPLEQGERFSDLSCLTCAQQGVRFASSVSYLTSPCNERTGMRKVQILSRLLQNVKLRKQGQRDQQRFDRRQELHLRVFIAIKGGGRPTRLLPHAKMLDLAEKLTEFEVKRNLTVLLDFYARKRQGISESSCSSPLDSVEKVAGYLLMITKEVFQDGFDVSERVRSLLEESREDIKNLMLVLKEKCDQKLSDPWSKLTLCIVISGEIFAVALANHEEPHQKQEVMKLLFTAAEDLCSRILKLGNWVS